MFTVPNRAVCEEESEYEVIVVGENNPSVLTDHDNSAGSPSARVSTKIYTESCILTNSY